mmetsp:Transcript_85232/g.222020  ORF Transcript_85232/g.222020 Transcript_85232/m.222020 type:complete len:81 (+) Transcript_85232:351-593(+)
MDASQYNEDGGTGVRKLPLETDQEPTAELLAAATAAAAAAADDAAAAVQRDQQNPGQDRQATSWQLSSIRQLQSCRPFPT